MAATTTTDTYQLDHPALGGITGITRGDRIAQFRGIPYASIPARFRQSVLAESLPSVPFDARNPGPTCPQLLLPFPGYWDAPVPAGYPSLPVPSQDEFNCLNLCITAPVSSLGRQQPTQQTPVLAFIHGGAFVGGSQSIQMAGREIYDAAGLVEASIARGKPVIVVTLNYRVGHLGFLASEQLAAHSRAHGEPVGNYGLHDQRQALEWIARFIGGFGGDPSRVTIHGTSAGGSSCHYQSIFPGRRFQRAIISSGTIIGIAPRPLAWHQSIFDRAAKELAPDAAAAAAAGSDSETVRALQEAPIQGLLQVEAPTLYNPLADGDWIPGTSAPSMESILHRGTESSEPQPTIMIGATEYERDLTRMLLSDLSTPLPWGPKSDEGMMAVAGEVFSGCALIPPSLLAGFPFSQPAVAEAYGLSRDGQQPRDAFDDWSHLLADLTFRFPPLHVAAATRKHNQESVARGDADTPPPPMYLYEIQAKNPYRGFQPTFDHANHGINDLMLFNPAEDLVEEGRLAHWRGAVAQVQGAWLGFCHGEAPWAPVDSAEGPVFVVQDAPEGRLCRALEEVDGPRTAARCRAVLSVV